MKKGAKIKRIVLVCLILALQGLPLRGQVMRVGVEAGGGVAMMDDELYRCAPMPSVAMAAVVDLGLASNPQMNQALTLRTGLGLLRRGGHFALELENIGYRRQGLYQGLYLQLPLLAHLRVELPPIAPYRNHWLTLSLGPVLSLALGGTLSDEQRCDLYPGDSLVNGSHLWQGADTYLHARRLDLGLTTGVGYQFDRLSMQAVWEVGFRPVRPVDEGELFVDVLPGVEPQGHNGYLSSLSLRAGYLLPVKERVAPRGPENPFKKR